MSETIKKLPFEEAVRKRPGMFLGSTDCRGVANMISGIIKDCIELCDEDGLFFKVSIIGDNYFSIEINGNNDLFPFLQYLTQQNTEFEYSFSKVFVIVTERLELINDNIHFLFANGKLHSNNTQIETVIHTGLVMNFEFDKSIFSDTKVDYLALNNELLVIAMLNRKTEIITADLRQKYLNQNYYYFPEGIFYLFEHIIYDSGGKPKLEIKYDERIEENKYQIAIANAGWPFTPSITSFANNIRTINHGAHVDGIIDGIVSACSKYVEENNLLDYKINKKNVLKGFMIVCSVKGGAEFEFGGSYKDKLLSKTVYSQIKELVHVWIYGYLQNDTKTNNIFLSLFDETRLFPFEKD